MKILICGIGAIGSNLTARLVSDLKGHEITVLDKDTVEERNITAGTQFYTREVIGFPKVEALQYLLQKWAEKEIKTINLELTSRFNGILGMQDLVIDCFDNHEARRVVQKYCKGYEQPLLHVGFSDNFTFAVEWAEHYKVPTDITSGFDICEMPGAAAFVNMVASIGAHAAEEFILNGKKLEFVGGKYSHSLIK